MYDQPFPADRSRPHAIRRDAMVHRLYPQTHREKTGGQT